MRYTCRICGKVFNRAGSFFLHYTTLSIPSFSFLIPIHCHFMHFSAYQLFLYSQARSYFLCVFSLALLSNHMVTHKPFRCFVNGCDKVRFVC